MSNIIVIGSIKGGVGKTTMALNMIYHLVSKGFRVCAVDADNQKSLVKWVTDRDEQKLINGSDEITLIEKSGNLFRDLMAMKKDYDYIVVDPAGRKSKELSSSLLAADFLISPAQSSQLDLDTVSTMIELIDNAVVSNPKLVTFFYQSRSSFHPQLRIGQKKDFDDVINHYYNELKSDFDLWIMDSVIHQRNVYATAVSKGKSVLEMDDNKAILEFNDFINEFLTSSELLLESN